MKFLKCLVYNPIPKHLLYTLFLIFLKHNSGSVNNFLTNKAVKCEKKMNSIIFLAIINNTNER